MERKKKSRSVAIPAILTAGMFALGGCDEKNDPSPDAGATPTSAATTSASQPGASQPGASSTQATGSDGSTGTTQEEGESPKTLAGLAAADPNFSTLVSALKAADLVDSLNGPGPLTVFAPTNAAFASLPTGALDSLLKDKDKLRLVLTHHVVSRKLPAAALQSTPRTESMAGFPLLVDSSSGVKVGPATVTAADVMASNGVLHAVDQVILPPSGNIVDLAKSSPELSTLVKAVGVAELGDALAADGPLTVFAPTNKAFAALPSGALDALLADKKALGEVLKNHVAGKSIYSDELKNGQRIQTLLGADELAVEVSASGVVVGGANVVIKDLLATNGVVHVIDAVIVPPGPEPKKIPELAIDDPRFSTLVKALKAADLVDALSGTGPLTVFAPTNDAFGKLPKGTLKKLLKPENKDQLRSILLHHVVDAKVKSADLPDTPYATSKAGFPLLIRTKGGPKISNAKVIEADLVASNGVVHAVDEVILPPSKSIVEIARKDRRLDTLAAALKRAHLVDTLKGDGPFTVFAPTDKAFRHLDHGVLRKLWRHRSELKNVLLFHVAGKTILSADLKDGGKIETLFDKKELSVEIESGKVKINGATVETADILATNGVIHVIDQVLTPDEDE